MAVGTNLHNSDELTENIMFEDTIVSIYESHLSERSDFFRSVPQSDC